MRWLLAIALLVGTIACAGPPAATSSSSTPTTAAAAAPKPSPQATAAPTASAPQPTTPVVAPAAAPKPSPASSVGSTAPAVSSAGAAATGAPSSLAPTGSPGATFGRGTVTLARADGQSRQLQVEVAADASSRSRGLMFRPSMPEDAGMIFLFPEDIDSAFWMQNTLIPLSIAFIAADGRILEIQDMQPQTTDFHRPAQRYRSALEVNQGYFARSGIKPGDRAELRRS